MSMRMVSLAFLSIMLLVNSASVAMEPEYLVGRWTPDGETGCDEPSSGFIDFDDQGIVRISRFDKVESVGFWEIQEGILKIHLLALPSFVTDSIQAPLDQPGYYIVRVLPFEVTENSFHGAVSHGEVLRRGIYVRCQS